MENHLCKHLQSSDEHQLVGNSGPAVQTVQTQFQSLPHDEETININLTQHGYQPIATILDSITMACADIAGAQINQTQYKMVPAGKENVSKLPQLHFIEPSSSTLHHEKKCRNEHTRFWTKCWRPF